jgi:hypothetical protein
VQAVATALRGSWRSQAAQISGSALAWMAVSQGSRVAGNKSAFNPMTRFLTHSSNGILMAKDRRERR